MIIISDASPIIALYEIDHLFLLKAVYDRIAITSIVAREVEIALPDWVEINDKYDDALYQSIRLQLDDGEASAIALAKAKKQAILVIDERRGRMVAKDMQIEIIGLLGVIVKAKKMGVVTTGLPVLQALVDNGFRLSPKLIAVTRKYLEEE
jgi:predicted nucleic acid-binding protein